MTLLFITLFGSFLVLMGLLSERFPRVVLPSKFKLPETEQGKAALKGYTRVFRICVCGLGVVLIAGNFLLFQFGLAIYSALFSGAAVMVLGSVLIIMRRKYRLPGMETQRLNGKAGFCILLFLLFCVGAYYIYPAKISADAERLVISGSYGLTIPLEEIDRVELIDKKPEIWEQANGIGIGVFCRGHYETEMGAVMQFLSSAEGPYLIVYSQNQKPIIINRRNPAETERLYAALRDYKQ